MHSFFCSISYNLWQNTVKGFVCYFHTIQNMCDIGLTWRLTFRRAVLTEGDGALPDGNHWRFGDGDGG